MPSTELRAETTRKYLRIFWERAVTVSAAMHFIRLQLPSRNITGPIWCQISMTTLIKFWVIERNTRRRVILRATVMAPRTSPRPQRSTWTTPWTEPCEWASSLAISKRASIRECTVLIRECRASETSRTTTTQASKGRVTSMTWLLRGSVLMPKRSTRGRCTLLMVSRTV